MRMPLYTAMLGGGSAMGSTPQDFGIVEQMTNRNRLAQGQQELSEAQREQMVQPSAFKRALFGGMSPEQFDKALAVQQAEQSQAGMQQAQGLSDVLTAAGMDPRSVPGIGPALAGPMGAEVATQLMQNPEFNPALAAQINQEALDREAAMTAAQKAERARIGGIEAGLREYGQEVGVIQDMRTLYQTVGSETLPTAAKGAFSGLRLRGLNAIRRTTESGALQEAEIKLFNEILPEGTEWTDFGRAEKMARLNQLEYWFTQKLENQIMASGEDYAAADYLNFGRDYDSILGPVPAGTEEGLGEGTGGGIMAPLTDAPGLAQPTIPGTNIPIASPLGVR